MKTQIFKNYLDFLNREDKSINGVDQNFVIKNPDFAKENETNKQNKDPKRKPYVCETTITNQNDSIATPCFPTKIKPCSTNIKQQHQNPTAAIVKTRTSQRLRNHVYVFGATKNPYP